MMKDYVKIAFENLRHRKMRAYLTMIGIFIGITAVVAIVSLGQGLGVAVDEQMATLGTDKIFVTPGTSLIGAASTAANLTERDRRIIDRASGVEDSLAFGFQSAKIEFKDDEAYVIVMAMTLDEGGEKLFKEVWGETYLMDGRLIEDGDNSKAYLTYDYTREDKVFSKSVKLYDNIVINGHSFEVVGFQDKVGNSGDDQTVYITSEAYERIFDKRLEDNYMQMIVRVKEGADMTAVAEGVKKDLRSDRGLDEGDEDFTIQTAEELIASFNEILLIVNVVIVGIASISLIIGGIGIMNTMYTAVVERTNEIGIMKAIGARNGDILFIFLIESGMLGLVGGIIGVAIGLGISKTVEIGNTLVLGTPYLRAWWSWELIAAALAFSFIVGTLSGLAPAYQASKAQPVEALRYE
ncbi:ABC transporter permease [Candidatus Woesearchaeota archaeon]|nr:ABC transporter permease [Candidatus Woesearchaeota archaeon]